MPAALNTWLACYLHTSPSSTLPFYVRQRWALRWRRKLTVRWPHSKLSWRRRSSAKAAPATSSQSTPAAAGRAVAVRPRQRTGDATCVTARMARTSVSAADAVCLGAKSRSRSRRGGEQFAADCIYDVAPGQSQPRPWAQLRAGAPHCNIPHCNILVIMIPREMVRKQLQPWAVALFSKNADTCFRLLPAAA